MKKQQSRVTDELILRAYSTADWPAICRIHDAARVQELAAGGVDPRAFRPMTEAAEGDEFFVSETVVACESETVVGFVSWNGDYVTWLYIDPLFQRRGVGSKLLQHALERIGPEAWTNLLGGNEAALSLYRAVGMEVVWTKPSECDGYPCVGLRVALPTSRMRDPVAKRQRPATLPGTKGAPMNLDRIHQIAVHARDLEEAVAFYRDLLGAKFVAKFDPPGIAFFDFAGVRVMLEKSAPKATIYFRVADLDVAYAELKAKGVPFVDAPHLIHRDSDGTFGPAGEEEWMAFFKDPSGNLLALASRKKVVAN